jgi:hypothetical protein
VNAFVKYMYYWSDYHTRIFSNLPRFDHIVLSNQPMAIDDAWLDAVREIRDIMLNP